jgi:hypothetical protein
MGRWLSRDPIGEKGGVRLYAFVANHPTDSVDPMGLLSIHVAFGRPQGDQAWGYKVHALAESLRKVDTFFLQHRVVDRFGSPCRISVDDMLTASGLSSFVFTPKDPISEGDTDHGPDYGVLWLKWEGPQTLATGNGPALFSPSGKGHLMTKTDLLRAKRPRCQLCYAGSMARDWSGREGLLGENWLVAEGRGAMLSSESNLDVILFLVKVLNYYKCCQETKGGPRELVARPTGDRIEIDERQKEPYTRIGGEWNKCPTCAPDKGTTWRCMPNDH